MQLCVRYRLLRYDPLHNSTEVLLDNLHFANGVQLSRYSDFVLVVETSRARVMKLVTLISTFNFVKKTIVLMNCGN